MDRQHAAKTVKGLDQQSYAHLQGPWLLFVRGLWGVLLVSMLTIVFASLPAYATQLQMLCSAQACQYQQLTPAQAATLQEAGLSRSDYAVYTVALLLISVVTCLVVSALIVWRRSDDRMAMLVALLLVLLGPVIETADAPDSPWLVPSECLTFLLLVALLLVFSLFPSGHFAPRRARWIFIAFLVIQIPANFLPLVSFLPDMPESQPAWLIAVSEMVTLALLQIYRYRRVSGPVQRQQTKWVIFGLAVPILIYVLITVLDVLFPALAEHSFLYLLLYKQLGFLLPLCLPLSFGLAMLRYRLWDIDALINRTLVYGLLTASLLAMYFALVFGGQYLLASLFGKDNTVVLVLSTLIVASLAIPLRRRMQHLVDRHFYRSKYDATLVVARFGKTLHHEVNLEQLSGQLLAVVQETMQPAHISLWISQSERTDPLTFQSGTLPVIDRENGQSAGNDG